MIVCICRAVCDRELKTTIAHGARSLDEVERACGAGGDCGSCRPDIERLLSEPPARPARACGLLVLARSAG